MIFYIYVAFVLISMLFQGPPSPPGNCPPIATLIAQHEGNETCVYTDSVGVKTIGIGFNLQTYVAREGCGMILI